MRALIVDDSKSILAAISRMMGSLSEVGAIDLFEEPGAAIEQCLSAQYDLIITDYMMPGMTGIELTKAIRQHGNYRTIPIVMVTSHRDHAVCVEAITAGVTEFLNKPFDPVELQARIRNLLSLRRAQIELAEHALRLEDAVERAIGDVALREEEIIWRLARAFEYRDGDTAGHVSRVAAICSLLAAGLGLDARRCRMIYLAAPLHDIGKIGIADTILGKRGKLTGDEIAQMREHVGIGVQILENGSSELLRVAEMIAGGHHEKWDGTGYPKGLAGEAIPLEARIAAVADVFDALCSERPYKRAWPLAEAYREIIAGSGSHFDPACVDVFRRVWPKIAAIMGETDADAAAPMRPARVA